MSVRLICFSQATSSFFDETDIGTMEELTAYFARVSNPSNQTNTMTAPKLINYLIKNAHWSPFEMVHATLEINTTRDIARQILRHRSFSFQEFSQRYADPTQMQMVKREARLQDPVNRQNSIKTDNYNLEQEWKAYQDQVIEQAKIVYDWAIENGIAKEQARAVLPEGLTASRLYMAGTLRSWIHYIQLRSKNGTQLEHAEIAKQCAEVLVKQFPLIKELVEG
jgi:thymidylate synthase (FAD)